MKEEAKGKGDVLRKLFFSCLYLSTFTFGGGYVIVTLMKKKFVDDYHWIDENEMLDLVAIAQSSPGPIAVNGAIFGGYDCNPGNDHSAVSDHFGDISRISFFQGQLYYQSDT